MQILQPGSKLGDSFAIGDVLREVDLADPDRALVLPLLELVEQRVFDLELTEIGAQVGDTKCAVAALADFFDPQRAISLDHGMLLKKVRNTHQHLAGMCIPTGLK